MSLNTSFLSYYNTIIDMSGMMNEQATNLPSPNTFMNAAKLAIEEEKPIMLDYWVPSKNGGAVIGVKGTEKILVKNSEEYTSTISNIYKVKTSETEIDYLVKTENSIYIVSSSIAKRAIA